MVLDTTLLNTRHYKVRIKSKVEKRVVPSPTPRCSNYSKGSLRVALDYDRQLYLYISLNNTNILYLHIFVYILSSCHIDFIVWYPAAYHMINAATRKDIYKNV